MSVSRPTLEAVLAKFKSLREKDESGSHFRIAFDFKNHGVGVCRDEFDKIEWLDDNCILYIQYNNGGFALIDIDKLESVRVFLCNPQEKPQFPFLFPDGFKLLPQRGVFKPTETDDSGGPTDGYS